jgi:hypothetical protein
MATRINTDHFDGNHNLTEGQRYGSEETLAELLDELAADVVTLQGEMISAQSDITDLETDVAALQSRCPETGGLIEWYYNRTGGDTVKGTVVEPSNTHDDAVRVALADALDPIGVIMDDGVAEGQLCRVCVQGKCQVLLKDTTAGTREYWVKVSDVAGRADATNASPPGAVLEHFRELGHCMESVAGGTDVLCWIHCHFL